MDAKPKVLLLGPIDQDAVRHCLRPHARVLVAKTRGAAERAVADADAVIARVCDPVSDSFLARARRLKVVGNYAVGLDNIDLKACANRGIKVVNTPKVLSRATAELALARLLAVARRVPEGEALCRTGHFGSWRPDLLLGLELKGRNAVIVGPGRIGKEAGRLFRGIGLKVEFISRLDSRRIIHEKLRRASVLSIHLPLTSDTRHWLDSRRLRLLPRDAVVVNTSRGGLIDTRALVAALRARRIFGAGLDVYEDEPHVPRELTRLKNVVLLPHVGSATRETRRAMAELVIQGVLGVLAGKQPWNQVEL